MNNKINKMNKKRCRDTYVYHFINKYKKRRTLRKKRTFKKSKPIKRKPDNEIKNNITSKRKIIK